MKRPVWLDGDFFRGIAFVVAMLLFLAVFGMGWWPLDWWPF